MFLTNFYCLQLACWTFGSNRNRNSFSYGPLSNMAPTRSKSKRSVLAISSCRFLVVHNRRFNNVRTWLIFKLWCLLVVWVNVYAYVPLLLIPLILAQSRRDAKYIAKTRPVVYHFLHQNRREWFLNFITFGQDQLEVWKSIHDCSLGS